MTQSERLQKFREDILATARRHGAHKVRVFGSIARGTADDHSDLDLIVEMEPGRTLFDLGGLQYELEQLLQIPVDVVTEQGLNRRYSNTVLLEAVPL